jgi:archaeal flagellar protein FlaI
MDTEKNNELFLSELKKYSQNPTKNDSFEKLKNIAQNNKQENNSNLKNDEINLQEKNIIQEKEVENNNNIGNYEKKIEPETNNLENKLPKLKIKEKPFESEKNLGKKNGLENNQKSEIEKKDFETKNINNKFNTNSQQEKHEIILSEKHELKKQENHELLNLNNLEIEKNNDFHTKYFNNENILNSEKEKQRKTMEFEWEKLPKIDKPQPEDFEITKTNYDWLKKQIKPNDEIIGPKWKHEIKKETQTNNKQKNKTTENQKIQKPKWIHSNEKEEILNTNELKTENKIITEQNKTKDKIKSNDQIMEKIERPKWLHKDDDNISNETLKNVILNTEKNNSLQKPKWVHESQNKMEQKTNKKQVEKKETSFNELKQESEGPKWLHKKQKEKTSQPTTEKQNEETRGPKWKHLIQEKNTGEKQTEKKAAEGLKWKHNINTGKNINEENKLLKKTSSRKWANTKKQDKKINEVGIIGEKKIESTDEEYVDLKKNYKKLKTPIDEMFEIVEAYGTVALEDIAKTIKTNYYNLEEIAIMFDEHDIIDLKYSTSLKAKANVKLKKPVISKLREIPRGEILSKYNVIVDNVPAEIKIVSLRDETRPIYAIEMPSIGKYTKKFLDFIKIEIAESMPIELEEILDPKKSKKLKERFFKESKKMLTKYFPTSNEETLQILGGTILHEMYGLGEIEVILGDDMLEEVAINSSKTPIAVYHRIHGWMQTNLLPGTEDEIMNYASQIGRKIGREITTLSPILDAHLLSGDRVNATLFPISSEGNTLTIRRFARKPWTLVDFIGKAHTMSSEMAALLWLSMQYEMNVIISGGTASGKTSALNTLLALVPSYHRIISIEDVREIVLPKYLKWNWIPMVTRSANPEGLGEVTMLDCMISSLRMRPDRIIVGEIRRKKEAEVMMEAIETGHSIYSTIHANSAYQVLRRMAEPPMAIPIMQIELIDLIVVQFRDRKTNKRRTFEIAEIEQTSAGKGLQVNTIYKWVPRTDKWEQLNKPIKLLTNLNQHTGLTEDEINKELDERVKILDWLQEKNINDLNQIGFIVKLFYINPDKVKKMAEQKIGKEQILEMIE